MSNDQIIAEAAISAGLYTEEQVQALYEAGKQLPLHTYAVWVEMGYVPRQGERGLKVKLWKHRGRKSSATSEQSEGEIDPQSSGNFYLVSTCLFDVTQVKRIEERTA